MCFFSFLAFSSLNKLRIFVLSGLWLTFITGLHLLCCCCCWRGGCCHIHFTFDLSVGCICVCESGYWLLVILYYCTEIACINRSVPTEWRIMNVHDFFFFKFIFLAYLLKDHIKFLLSCRDHARQQGILLRKPPQELGEIIQFKGLDERKEGKGKMR